MDLSVFSSAIQNALGSQLPNILGAVGILVLGYLIALAAKAGVRKVLSLARINAMVGSAVGRPMDVENSISLGAFWFVLLATIIAVFNSLKLDQLSGPFAVMMSQITAYLPHLLAGLVLGGLAWLVASIVKAIANRAIKSTRLDDKLADHAGMPPMGENMGNILFWLVILMFLPAVLGALQLGGMLDPVRNMVDEILVTLPNIFAAVVIVFAGWLVAKIVRGLVSNLLAGVGADKLGEAAGLKGTLQVSRLVGVLVFILILVPALIAALETLNFTSVSRPAAEMLEMIMLAIPNIFAAALILFVTWYVARYAAALLGALLANLGLNALPAKLGLEKVFSDHFQASDLVTRIVVFFAMLFATDEAAHRLDFGQVQALVTMFIAFGGDVLLGSVILLIGFWLANLAYQAVLRASDRKSVGPANIVRFSILGLVLAMGLSAMGIADEIVNMTFALLVGAVAVAIALSFGLGGREAAGKQMEYWLAKLRKD